MYNNIFNKLMLTLFNTVLLIISKYVGIVRIQIAYDLCLCNSETTKSRFANLHLHSRCELLKTVQLYLMILLAQLLYVAAKISAKSKSSKHKYVLSYHAILCTTFMVIS